MVPALESLEGRDLTNVSSLPSLSPETRRDPTNPAESATVTRHSVTASLSLIIAPPRAQTQPSPARRGVIKGLVNVLMSECQNMSKLVGHHILALKCMH